MLAQSLAMYDDIQRHLGECDSKLRTLMTELAASRVDLGRAPRAGSKRRVEFDLRQLLANWAGVDLTRINGLGVDTVLKLLTEIGPDLSRFATVKHFCSWLGLCPGTKISGGKVLSSGHQRAANRARQALKLAAQSLWHSQSALGAFYPPHAVAHGHGQGQHRHGAQARALVLLHAHRTGARRSSIRANSATKSSSASDPLRH